MKPLIVLLFTFIVSLLFIKIINNKYMIPFSGRIAMSVMLLFTALGHFIYTEGMIMMVPNFLPFKKEIIFLTGFIEIMAAIAIHFSSINTLIGWFLILFFILMLPSNIKAAINQIDYQTATYNGKGISYLYFRIPLQILFIAWVYISCIKPL
jgi:uncharacterized membrane protein